MLALCILDGVSQQELCHPDLQRTPIWSKRKRRKETEAGDSSSDRGVLTGPAKAAADAVVAADGPRDDIVAVKVLCFTCTTCAHTLMVPEPEACRAKHFTHWLHMHSNAEVSCQCNLLNVSPPLPIPCCTCMFALSLSCMLAFKHMP